MGMPLINGELHHGMTKIIADDNTGFNQKFKVKMQNPDFLFEQLNKIDFIKIDVEGYESTVFENMKSTINKHKPLIQSELSGAKNRSKVIFILEQAGYETCILENSNFIHASDSSKLNYPGDFYFRPKENEN